MRDAARAAPGIFLALPDASGSTRAPAVDAPGSGRALAVKDLFDTEGLTTTYGSAVFRDHIPRRTATAVRRLQDRGWSLIGKTNLHEFAYGITSQNPHYGTVPNPIAPGRVAGGSSGGNAAALAAGLCAGALGTDTGGSIRIPAAWCGVVGFKPTFGLVPMEGCFPLAPSFDHAGPMALDVETCAEMLGALVPGFERERLDSLDELRLGAAEGVEHKLQRELDRIRVGEFLAVELPPAEGAVPAFMRDVAATHAELFAEHRDLYGDNVATKVERCLQVSDAEAEAAARSRVQVREQFAELFGRVDLLLTPTVPLPAPPIDVDELEIRAEATRLTFPFNAVGAPALALGPVQLAGAPGSDALVLAAGRLLEAALEAAGRGWMSPRRSYSD